MATTAKKAGTTSAQKSMIGNDVLIGSDSAQLAGGAGNDTYNLWSSTATVLELAGEGIDTVNARFWGTATLANNVENLVLFTKGSTLGIGNALDNSITASAYGSTLNGMGGNDRLIGGAGADVFEFAKNSGSDTIVNFQLGWDSIRLQNFGLNSFEDLLAHGHQVGANAQFTIGGSVLTIEGVSLSDIQASDFGFALAAPAVPQGYFQMDGAGRAYNSHGWYVHNNAWGSGALTEGKDFTIESVYSRDDMTSGTTFTWTYPYQTDTYSPILAYPEVSFGVNPKAEQEHKGNATDTAAVFPVQVADIVSLVADYDVSFGGTVSGFNVSYDIWLTNVPFGGRDTITNEIMVWVHTGDFPPMGEVVGTYTQDGFTASIYHKGTYTAVVTDKDVPQGELDIAALLSTLEELGIVSSDEYLASIDLGAEIVSGNGSFTVNNLDFTLETREDDGTVVRKEVTGSGTTVTEIPPEPAITIEEPVVTVEDIVVSGSLVGFKTTTDDGTGSKTEWCNRAGNMIRTEVVTQSDNISETKFYGANNEFLGADRFAAKGGGETMALHFDAKWNFVKAEDIFAYSDGRVSTRHFDANWNFTGATEVSTKSNGVVLTRFLDSGWQLSSAQEVSVKDGVTSTRHFDGNWKLTGSENVQVRDDGSTWTQHFDGAWKFTGAEVSRPGADGIMVTTSYDAKWATIERCHEGTIADDTISAGWGTNTIHGGFGSDILIGGGGADKFVMDTLIGNGDVDQIGKFQAGVDKIVLDSDVFHGLGSFGALDSAAFVTGTEAKDASDRIVYDRASGDLFYDFDGSGSGEAILFANVQNHAVLSANDFVII